MKKTLLLTALAIGIGMTPAPLRAADPTIVALGPGKLCEAGQPLAPICAGYVPGRYMLLVSNPASLSTVAYRYVIVATLAATGASVTLHGVFEGYGDTGAAVLNFGGIVRDWRIVLEELVVTAVSVSVQTVQN